VHEPSGQGQRPGRLVGQALGLGPGHEGVPPAAPRDGGQQVGLGHRVGCVDEEVVDRARLGGVHLDGQDVHRTQREAGSQNG
jgi:hypothetical protein